MKRFLAAIPFVCILMMCLLSSACSIGTYKVSFVTYSQYELQPQYYGYDKSWNLPTPFGKGGYEFVGWYYDEEYTNPVQGGTRSSSGDVVLYAKYQIDENFYTGYTIDWDNSDAGANKSGVSSYRGYLINKTNNNYILSCIELQSSSDLQCTSLVVYDANGQPVEDVNDYPAIWQPKDSQGFAAGQWVVEFVATTNSGTLTLFVS